MYNYRIKLVPYILCSKLTLKNLILWLHSKDHSMLDIIDIKKRYPKTQALNGVSLSVKQGQIVSLLARNGAGKSTLISIIAGLLDADEGDIAINQQHRSGKLFPRHIQQTIGLAGQDSGIYPGLSVYDNFLFFCELYGIPRKQRQQRIQEITRLLELSELLNRNGNELSGGERRRLHMGYALLHRPKVLLLDEPTVGADPQARNAILAAVKTIANEGTAILYTSHYLPEIEALEADIVIMEKGHVLERGTQQELIQRHADNALMVEFTDGIASIAVEKLPGSHCISDNSLKIPQATPSFASTFTPVSLIQSLGELGDHVCSIRQQTSTLENIFYPSLIKVLLTHPSNN